MPRLQKWGSFFLPRKQKSLSLSFSRAQNTQPRAYARRTSLFRFTRMKKPLSDLSLLLRKSAFERAQVVLSFVRIRCFSLFLFFAWKNEAFCLCAFSSSFFHSFFFVESSRFGSFSPPALHKSFFQNERTKKSTRHPQHPLLSLRLFLWENALLSIRFTSSTQ